VVVGTAALEAPELVVDAACRHPGRVVVALDARDGRVAIHGWREVRSERLADVMPRFSELPLAAVMHTDIGRDGILAGPNVEATVALTRMTRIPVIASGGVRSVADLLTLARTRVIAGAIVGRALYTGDIRLPEALQELARC
jgi:phosphoribosylformimino-5-aminoimidazole carboxamide ribotide isomerase